MPEQKLEDLLRGMELEERGTEMSEDTGPTSEEIERNLHNLSRRSTILASGDLKKSEAILYDYLSRYGAKLGKYGQFYNEWSNCSRCNLQFCSNKQIPGTGSLNARVLVLGEAPGPEEDQNGVVLSGPTGTMLREALSKIGMNLEADVYFTNSLGCIPKDTMNSKFRSPRDSEIATCLPRIKTLLTDFLPNVKGVLLVGKSAYLSWSKLIQEEHQLLSLKSVLGWIAKDGYIPAYTIYHPSFLARTKDPQKYSEIYKEWIWDLRTFFNHFIENDEIKNWRK